MRMWIAWKEQKNMMVRQMCGVSLMNKIYSAELNGRLCMEGVADIVRHGPLRWFGLLKRKPKDDLVSTCRIPQNLITFSPT